jgi:predicted nucleic acid-binding Zn ribbon protein
MYEAASAYDAKADVEKKEIDDLAVGVDTSAEEAPAAICPKKKMAKLPNGKTCVTCGKNLHGQQRRFCSNSCSNSYSYLSTRHPEATPVEIKTLVAGSGWQDAGKKRRKYRSFDAEKAEKNRLRASMSRVPDLV